MYLISEVTLVLFFDILQSFSKSSFKISHDINFTTFGFGRKEEGTHWVPIFHFSNEIYE